MSGERKPKKLLLVVNPKAGKCMAKQKLFELVSLFSAKGYETTVYPTKKDGTTDYVKDNAHKYGRVVCCGGDGTLSEVLAGVYKNGNNIPVAYIPMGSTNDFASNMGIPRNTALASMAAAKGKVVPYDLGLFNGKPFAYVAAIGAFTAASYSAPQKLKNRFGHFAYVIEAAKSIASIKPITMTVEINGVKLKDRFIYASVGNTTSMGGVLKLNKDDVDFADGVFEVLLMKHPQNTMVALEMIYDLLSGHFKTKNIAILHAKNVKLSFETPTVFSLDGEKSEPCLEAVITAKKAAVNVIVPKTNKNSGNKNKN